MVIAGITAAGIFARKKPTPLENFICLAFTRLRNSLPRVIT